MVAAHQSLHRLRPANTSKSRGLVVLARGAMVVAIFAMPWVAIVAVVGLIWR
jgi:hypothetical protein